MAGTLEMQTGISADEFMALEMKVTRAIEVVRRERDARAAAESEVAALKEQLSSLTQHSNATQAQLTTLHQEREAVRVRVEKMLEQMDEML